MADFNRVILMGRITRDIEVRYISSGTAVTDIGLAVNDRRKKGDEWIEETSFFEVTLWGRTAELAGEYLGKGSPLFVEGRLKQDTWETDGQKRSKVTVVGDRIQFIGGKGEGGRGGGSHQSSGQQSSGQQSSYNEPISSGAGSSGGGGGGRSPDDEIPF